MKIEEESVGKLAHLLKSSLSPPRLIIGHCDAGGQAGDDQRRRRDNQFVAANEFARAITDCVLARDDWQAFQVAADVFRKLFDRLVASLRLLAHRHQHDIVQIARKLLAQSCGSRGRTADRAARLFGFGVADRAFDLHRRHGFELMRADAGQQFV
ncbi:MAG: hypothetical protein JMDDDDMK_00912 [Acidobacteria bacterium]|nr:hypothetical protein [Acidobacteriota bacterium]